ncbi:MAG: hypothetical protein GTO53_04550 [Planctomycetales bacterium]|nr:hypothetical protein [Planctomycetales bacterium]NIM08427.1 hypothetical protein [Planctomycetales bacterium]NIN07903.1 hypothetical protein [Planctomycetales bacterium]NIN77033.1 hypothetical protein [Planctomycetales bacterium]NIO34215.1 hypothetical protein [Planctomycetales bacterium]
MPTVRERIQELHHQIGRGRPYTNPLLDAVRVLADTVPEYPRACQLVDGVRKMYDMKNRRTLREAPAGDKQRQLIEQHLEAFDQILKILHRKVEEQTRQPPPAPPPAGRFSPPAGDQPASEVAAGRAKSVEVQNVLSALQAVNEAVISLRFVLLDNLVVESATYRGKVTEMITIFQNQMLAETREMAVAMVKRLEHNFKLWQREAAALKARIEAHKDQFFQRDKDKFRQQLVVVPNQYGIAERQLRRLINALDLLIKQADST